MYLGRLKLLWETYGPMARLWPGFLLLPMNSLHSEVLNELQNGRNWLVTVYLYLSSSVDNSFWSGAFPYGCV